MSALQRPAGFQGYHQVRNAEEDAELTHVGPGTPCGEYLRRYWQPVAMSEELGELPMVVRILGEDLVLFRDRSGRPGLLHRHCAHRGASLEYGIVAERGIICCYHGWHYDVDGTILRAGSEPPDSPICRNVVQGAYPVHEHNDLLFAYLGPPEDRPPFPVFDSERMPDATRKPFSITTPCNWLQVYENTQDPIHVLHLHARVSGVQFGVASGIDQVIEYQDTPLGMMNVQTRQVGEHLWVRTVDSILPNANQTGAIWEEAEAPKAFQRCSILRWMVPVDDTATRTIGWRFFSDRLDPRGQDSPELVGRESIDFVGQTEDERSVRGAPAPARRLRGAGLAAAHRHSCAGAPGLVRRGRGEVAPAAAPAHPGAGGGRAGSPARRVRPRCRADVLPGHGLPVAGIG